jgi:DNA-binding protein YbaB
VAALADWQQQLNQLGQQVERGLGEQERRLAERTIEVQAGAGMVKVTVDGRGRVRGIVLHDEVFAGRDSELLADLLLGAIAEAQRRAADAGEDGTGPGAR